MSKTVETTDPSDLICDLKAVVAAMECQHKMNLMKEQTRQPQKSSSPPPMFLMIPLEQKMKKESGSVSGKNVKGTTKHLHKHENNHAMKSTNSVASSGARRKENHRHNDDSDAGEAKLRGGILHTRCCCIHRDGMQDTCPMTGCQNHPNCATKPWPDCPPARYFRSRFPDLCPMPLSPDAVNS